MSFTVQSDNLRGQARVWEDRADAVRSTRTAFSPAVGRGSAFGVLAGGAGVQGMYDEWTRDIDDALHDAELSCHYLQQALRSTADAYDETDTTVAISMERLDALVAPEDYRHA